jgi:two-component system, sensor histidine kinase and response regulator
MPAGAGVEQHDEVRTPLQRRLLRESGLILSAHPLLIALIVWYTWNEMPHSQAVGWALAVVLATVFRVVWLRTVNRRTLSDRDIWFGVRVTIVLLGLTWGAGTAIAFQDLSLADGTLVLVVLAGVIAGALTTLAADLPSFLGFVAAIAVPACFGVLVDGHDRDHLATAAVLAGFTLVMAFLSRRAHATIRENVHATTLLRDARDLAENSARTRAAFLANMSHEIRTPMNAVLGFVELVLDTDLTNEQRRALELVRSSSETLVTILNDILDYSKIQAEHLDLESISFDLSKLIYSTASLLAVRAREKHLELLAEVPPSVPRMVRGDPTRLRQVLTNLIGNAIKFTEQGEVVVSAAVVETGGGHARVEFGVRDTGIGIAPEHVQAIFKEFTQADASMTRRHGGTGLGLSISEKLVRLMGGELVVTSQVGQGSRFEFILDLPVDATSDRLPVGQATLGGRRTLVLDDNPTNRRILRDMLGAEGMAVDEASNATAGLAALRGAVGRGFDYELVILDAQMPDRDGFEVAAMIRADPALASIRLMMLTSAGQRGDGERCRALGIEAYLNKPVSRVELVDALGAVFAGPHAAGAPELITRHTMAESRTSLHILLAEDTAMNQQIAVAMLVKRGHLVDVVNNGREAVEAVTGHAYDVVLMDLQMPEMDGFQATEAIRAQPGGRDLPIIALTAHALSGQREECLAHGMTGYLTKPFKGHELFALIEGHPARRRDAAGTGTPGPRVPADLEALRTSLREVGAEAAANPVLDTFLQEAPECMGALSGAITGGQADDVARAAHSFRGVAATIRAHELAELLERVEVAAARGDVAPAREGIARIHDEAAAVLEYVRRDRGASAVLPR